MEEQSPMGKMMKMKTLHNTAMVNQDCTGSLMMWVGEIHFPQRNFSRKIQKQIRRI